MIDVIALGEILIDFTPCGVSEAGQVLFERNPGGAPANVLTALSKCGKKTALIGKVGDDMFGTYLKSVLQENHICTDGLLVDESVFTTLAFVALAANGERSFSFSRKPGADTCLMKEEVREDLIRDSRVFHLGSLSLTAEPARSATFEALKIAKEAGCIISYDPNYRAPLWESREAAIAGMRSVLPYVDVMKLSDEETELMTGEKTPEKAAEILLSQGVRIVVVTLGADGALVCMKDGCMRVPGYKAQMVDTTGAGDSFWGGFLNCLLESGKKLTGITLEEAIDFTDFGNALASLCVEKRGAIPAMPERADIEKRRQRRKNK
ncbi:MAG: carbohydrate kinase [Clostridia bacterium]|nr:carbohydrate kinase [Clostridia bacterium]